MATSTIQAERTLLWKNPSPSSGRGAFTVELPKAYGAYLVVYASDVGNSTHISSIVLGDGANTTASGVSSGGQTYSRAVAISGTTASFGQGYFSGSANNNATIPNAIYGIK